MSLEMFDIVRSSLETDVLGTTPLLIGAVLLFVGVLMVVSRIPPTYGFLLATPALLLFASGGLLPTWVAALVWVVAGGLWAVVLRSAMQ